MHLINTFFEMYTFLKTPPFLFLKLRIIKINENNALCMDFGKQILRTGELEV